LSVAPGRNRLKIISDFIKKRKNQTGIIYCLSRKNTEYLADSLRREGINAKYYHAKMDAEDRNRIQNEFIKDKIQVIVATIAFGMGIDKSNVRWVIHYSLPSNIESFYQEIGRAGRDGMRADTLLFYSYNDIMIRHDMIQNSELPLLMKEVQQAKLDRMKQYAEAEICRRRILLSYFNEAVEKDCGNCDICQNPPLKIDATIIAQKALSAITRTNEKVAMGMLIDILRGSNNKKIIDHRYHELKTFGVGKDLKIDEWADYIQQMLNSGVMDIAYEDAHTFKLNNTSNAVLHDGKKVNLVRYESYDAKKTRKEEAAPKEKTKKEIVRDALFERLRALRKDIADKKDIPAFVVFSDATLADMAQRRPINKSQMMDVSGIGEQKMQQYGNVFIDEIVLFLRENNQTGNKIASKGLTYLETFDLYQKGFSPAEIAQTRNLSETTIFSHLATLFEEGKKIDLYQYITKAEVQTILQAAESINTKKGDAIKPLYDAMDEQYEYYKIRLALTLGNR
jgi:ATP-dependent DNA helicase RecQ